jgi:GNAT superfamily N-acetyltransferase
MCGKDGVVIGTIQGIVCEELYGNCIPFLLMKNFVVAENYQGKGIRRNLLKELERVGKARNCSQ